MAWAWTRSPQEGPSGGSRGCGFGWGQWPLLGAWHLEAIRPGVGSCRRGPGRGACLFQATHRPNPSGAVALGPEPCCWLCLPPTPLSLQPRPLPLAASPARCDHIICNNIACCVLGASLLWPRVGLPFRVDGLGDKLSVEGPGWVLFLERLVPGLSWQS